MYPVDEISNKILELVSSTADRTLLGVRLGFMLKRSFPDFAPYHYQCRNLRQFVRTHVPAVSEKGHSGTDVIYSVGSPSEPANDPAPYKAVTSNFVPLPMVEFEWKAYSNPAQRLSIAANRETGELKVLGETETPHEPWIALPKPSSEFHREIAEQFVSTLPEPLRTTLVRTLNDHKWYVRFSTVAKVHGVGMQWASFRRAKLIEKFKLSLNTLGIPERLTHAKKIQPATLALLAHAVQPHEAPSAPTSNETNFRELVQRVIAELPISELRSLRLPVGLVVDALRR